MPLNCIVCDEVAIELRQDYRSEHAAFSGMKLAHCAACGMVFAHPMPQDAELARYNARYFANAHGGKASGPVAEAFFSGIARLRCAHVENYLGSRWVEPGTVFEFGPGSGHFARAWLERHPGTTYFGLETDTSCHAALRAAGVHVVPEGGSRAPTDLMVMSHVLEHVTRPKEFLRDATSLLRQGGALFVEVPCQDWRHKPMDEPHLLFFEKASLRRLLGDVGFMHIEVSYHGKRIDDLLATSRTRAQWEGWRNRLLSWGLVAPFGRRREGMECLATALERAAVNPTEAHLTMESPAWWLRAMAIKA